MRTAGIKCEKCGFFHEISIMEIQFSNEIICPCCQEKTTLNDKERENIIENLQKIKPIK